ncbi:CotY/CotZ family spore coat protein [Peribacillus tepidiphilus]|jgi:hypothetical protein|uniref:CotY/CotZ family spore coat protein n=1 Tax=Peribacillus tepidiphilus TaxID=2652445 RepID=UPI0035B55FFE
MGCGHDKTKECVCDALRAVAEAQDRVDRDCDSSCNRAVKELVGRENRDNFDTIPLLLTCNCKPFEGVGARRSIFGKDLFNVERSFLFRVNKVDKNCCATLELLEPIDFFHDSNSYGDESLESSDSSEFNEFHKQGKKDHQSDFEKFLKKLDNAKKIKRTGICITCDLNAFTSVSCLPPVETHF